MVVRLQERAPSRRRHRTKVIALDGDPLLQPIARVRRGRDDGVEPTGVDPGNRPRADLVHAGAPAEAPVRLPNPERFENDIWVMGDVVGWVIDPDPAKFGLVTEPEHLPPIFFQPDAAVRARGSEMSVLIALRAGELTAYDPVTGKRIEPDFWIFKNEGDIREAIRQRLSFRRAEVLGWLSQVTGTPSRHVTSASEGPKPQDKLLRRAPDAEINRAIEAVYDQAETERTKPPNIKELVTPVQENLSQRGFEASGAQIQRLGDHHASRRLRPGKRYRFS